MLSTNCLSYRIVGYSKLIFILQLKLALICQESAQFRWLLDVEKCGNECVQKRARKSQKFKCNAMRTLHDDDNDDDKVCWWTQFQVFDSTNLWERKGGGWRGRVSGLRLALKRSVDQDSQNVYQCDAIIRPGQETNQSQNSASICSVHTHKHKHTCSYKLYIIQEYVCVYFTSVNNNNSLNDI